MPGCSLGGAGSFFVACVRPLLDLAVAEVPRGEELRGRDEVRLVEAMQSRYPRGATEGRSTRALGRAGPDAARWRGGQAPQTPTRLPLAATVNTPSSGVTAWM